MKVCPRAGLNVPWRCKQETGTSPRRGGSKNTGTHRAWQVSYESSSEADRKKQGLHAATRGAASIPGRAGMRMARGAAMRWGLVAFMHFPWSQSLAEKSIRHCGDHNRQSACAWKIICECDLYRTKGYSPIRNFQN